MWLGKLLATIIGLSLGVFVWATVVDSFVRWQQEEAAIRQECEFDKILFSLSRDTGGTVFASHTPQDRRYVACVLEVNPDDLNPVYNETGEVIKWLYLRTDKSVSWVNWIKQPSMPTPTIIVPDMPRA